FVGSEEGWALSVFLIPFLLLSIIYFLLIAYHNKLHPKRKMSLFSFIPYELREDDEGLQYLTFKAMRKVYIFYYIAIPVGILLISIFENLIPHFSMWLLVAFGVIQYFIYWLGIRHVIKEED